jgi:uncharacterized protein (TIGR03083 family)
MALTDDDFLEAHRREGEAMAAAAEGHLDHEIPSLEGWTVAHVIDHTGSGDQWVTGILGGLSGRESLERVEAGPSGDALLPWFRDQEAALQAALAAIPEGATGWTLQGRDRPLTFWRRRRAQENAVHRWDVESAGASPSPIDAELAIDGVDEMFEVFVPRMPAEKLAGEGQTLHLHATDPGLAEGAGEWLITMGPDGMTWEHGHAKGDVAARAPASDLLLFLWGRVPPSRLEVFGDAALLDLWQATVRIG